MTRAVALIPLVASVLVFDSLAGEVLPSGPAVAGPAPARTAQSYYQPPPTYPLPTPQAPGQTPVRPLLMMTPFPIVRILGQTTRNGARIRILSVRAPASATILVRCRRQRCSARTRRQGRGIRRPVRFKRFERRLRAGTILEVFVGRAGAIGKYTRFRIRRNRAPSRRDLCLLPGATRGSTCPEV